MRLFYSEERDMQNEAARAKLVEIERAAKAAVDAIDECLVTDVMKELTEIIARSNDLKLELYESLYNLWDPGYFETEET